MPLLLPAHWVLCVLAQHECAMALVKAHTAAVRPCQQRRTALRCRVVDFGPGWFNPQWAFDTQRRLNPKGKSPPFCSEF